MPSTPLRIAELRPGPDSGIIGITFAPGKKGRSLYGGYHDRDLDADLDVFAAWGAAAVVTLVEEPELHELQMRDLEKEVPGNGPTIRRWPSPSPTAFLRIPTWTPSIRAG